MKKLIATFLIATCAQLASADGLKSLESFMTSTQSGRADFTQVVTSPPKDGKAARSKTSSGTFEFQRPGRFKFVYQKPFEQTIVADGKTLWLYDVDDILDSFGQRSLIRFTGLQANPTMSAAAFQFQPPAGADVVKQ